MYFETLHELFQSLETKYKGLQVPPITGGIDYEDTQCHCFDYQDDKWVQVSIYRMPSGRYELTSYLC